jgi:transcriptional antiterminator RfaH
MAAACLGSSEMQITTSNWFAVRVKSRAEDVVSNLLMYKGYTTYVPRSGGNIGQRSSCRPLLPGYVLCQSNKDANGLVVTTPFVLSLVTFGGAVAPIAEAEIDHLRVVERSGVRAQPWAAPAAGVRMRITAGPLAGLEGRFVRLAHRDLFLVSVEMLQRSVCIEIDPALVKWLPMDGLPAAGSAVATPEHVTTSRQPIQTLRAAASGNWSASLRQQAIP